MSYEYQDLDAGALKCQDLNHTRLFSQDRERKKATTANIRESKAPPADTEALERSRAKLQLISVGISPGSDEDAKPKGQVSYQGKKYLGNSEGKFLKKSSVEWDLAVTARCKRMGLGGSGLTHTRLASLSSNSLLSKCPAGRLGTGWFLIGGSVCWRERNSRASVAPLATGRLGYV